MKLSIEKILVFYISITPLFWFWFIPTEVMTPFKLAFLVLVIFLLVILKRRKIRKEYVFLLAFMAIATLPSFFRTSIGNWLYKYVLYLLIILTISGFYNFFVERSTKHIVNFFKKPSLIVAVICLITVINYFTGFPDWREAAANEFYDHFLYQTGFSVTRTSWTPAISFFFITNLYYFFNEKRKKPKLLFLCAAIVVFMSQMFSAGRSGLLISFSAIIYYIFIKVNIRVLLMIFLAVLLIIIPQIDKILEITRLQHIDFTSFEAVNNFTTGRLAQWVWGIEKLFEDYNYLIGAGYDHEDSIHYSYKYGWLEIHNFWIHASVRGGLLMLFFYLVFTVYYVRKSYFTYRKDKNAEMFMIIITCGLVGTWFEPSLILGKVQTTIIWWISLPAIDIIASRVLKVKTEDD